MDPSTVVTAFGSGQIDAAGIWYPLIDTIKRRVPNLVELAKNEEFAPGTTFPTVFVARNQVAAQNPGLVKKMVALIREANDYRAAHVQPVVATTAKFLKVPEANLASEAKNVRLFTSAELAASTRDGSITRWLTNLSELFVSFGKLDKPADPAGYYLADAYLSAT
jgi:NitT/TauT family transport system substrate-binding protein